MLFNIDVSNEVLADANALKSSNVQQREIKDHVIDILRRVNDELRAAHNEGRHTIIVEIPILYSISNMTIKDSQRVVWSCIIDILKNKNYRVFINPTHDKCRLKITWLSLAEEKEIHMQKQVLMDHTANF